jgi:hypothetical protein
MDNADWAASWTALNGFLIFFLPVVISASKYFIKSLDGPAAYWLGLGIQFSIGLLAWLTTGDPAQIAIGATAGLATAGVYEGAKRAGLAEGSRKRGVR